jgi:hypothetical protein
MCDIDPDPKLNFLSFAVYNNLSSYVDAKVTMDHSFLKPGKETPLLAIALWRILRNTKLENRLAVNLDTLKMLLVRGANPNERYQEDTVWRHAINYLHVEYEFSCGSPGSVHETWPHAVKLMLQHGADPHVCCVGDRKSWAELEQEPPALIAKEGNAHVGKNCTLETIILEVFAIEYPEGASELLQLLAEKKRKTGPHNNSRSIVNKGKRLR